MTPDRLQWLEGIADSGRKTVGVAFFREALAALRAATERRDELLEKAERLGRLESALQYLHDNGGVILKATTGNESEFQEAFAEYDAARFALRDLLPMAERDEEDD